MLTRRDKNHRKTFGNIFEKIFLFPRVDNKKLEKKEKLRTKFHGK